MIFTLLPLLPPLLSLETEYISFLKNVTPNTVDDHMTQLRRFNMGIAGEADCPVFDGLYEYCQASCEGRSVPFWSQNGRARPRSPSAAVQLVASVSSPL